MSARKAPAAKDNANVSVYCRIRPLSKRDTDHGGVVTITTDGSRAALTHAGEVHNFAFDKVFDLDATQQQVFDGVRVSDSVNSVLGGYNATIFAYGQTASGKTHTMEGADIGDPVTRGIIPRAAAALFAGVAEAPGEIEFAIKVSFVEIYLERIRDLLDTFGQKKTNLQIREDPNSGIYVAGCTETFATRESELLKCMHLGHRSRATAATGMNEGSSRSHSVLSCTVQQKNTETDATRVGKLVLVDLAGSEMVRKTHAAGQQLEEAKTINKSLSALGQVINALTDDKKAHVPYRDSKLTRMLQDSLGGNAKTALIVACSASTENSFETLSTLRFGQRAAVKNKPKVNERKSVEELTALLHKAEAAIDMQSTYIAALELQILDLQQKIASLTEELAEERAESKRCAKEARDLTNLLHEKETLLVQAGELMAEVEAKMEETVADQASLAAKAEPGQGEAGRGEKAEFRVRELELRPRRSTTPTPLRKEDADDAAISRGVSGGAARPGGRRPRLRRAAAAAGAAARRRDAAAARPLAPRDVARAAEAAHQRAKLVADLEAATRARTARGGPRGRRRRLGAVATRERQHMRSLQQRLEQLVAVHRQLLRKYAALELNLGESAKMIALRDERILALSAKRHDAHGRAAARLVGVGLSLVTKAGDRIDVGECRDGSPATDDMVRAGVRWRNVDGSASSARLRKLRDALEARRPVSIAVVGGSFTIGTGCEPGKPDARRPASLATRRWRSWALQLGLRLPSPTFFDAVFWDYGCNDQYAVATNASAAGLLLALESAVRLALDRGAAFALVRTCHPASPATAWDTAHLVEGADDLAARVYGPLAALYGVPLLSYTAAVDGFLSACEARRREKRFDEARYVAPGMPGQDPKFAEHWESQLWDNIKGHWGVDNRLTAHPGCRARRFVADFVFRSLYNVVFPALGAGGAAPGRCRRRATAARSAAAAAAATSARRAATPLPELRRRPRVGPLGPRRRRRDYRRGWRYGEDAPGRAAGWIASSGERGKEPRAAWVAFSVTLVRGFVTVQYLETYEDAGAFELWIGSTPGSNHDVEGVVPQPAHNSDRSAYKSESAVRGAPVSYFNTRSVFVDTWAKNRTTSELALRTFDFAAHGEHLLHLRHVRPKKRELAKRGGDEVKIVAITAC
ncbi:hypothetical protein JL721_12256 [Aureococcus anophagefferens]|nr:hypothetical protein JL721_12256 [Aureococcus anophagefferens]